MNYEDIPLIVNVKYLRAHDLLVEFDNGEERVVDISDSFEVPAALKYAPLSEFKNFRFNKWSISWGNLDSRDSMDIGNDSIYNMSIPVPQFVSSVFLSMGVVDHRTEPFEGWIKVNGNEEKTGHKEPHAHVEYNGNTYLFALYGGLLVPSPNTPTDILSKLDDWVQKNKKICVDVWNEWNPTLQADPETGRRI